jgi:hypothetical protein
MMDFYEVLDQVIDLLKQRGRTSYRALKVQFHLDDSNSRYSPCNAPLHLNRMIFEGLTSPGRPNAVQIMPQPSERQCSVSASFMI